MAKDPSPPPFVLDGARVIEYALLEPGRRQPQSVVGGVTVGPVAGVVIAESLADGGILAMHCNADWESFAVAYYADAAAARKASEGTYEGIAERWQASRPLSAQEKAELETTRAFLRSLQEDFPGGV